MRKNANTTENEIRHAEGSTPSVGSQAIDFLGGLVNTTVSNKYNQKMQDSSQNFQLEMQRLQNEAAAGNAAAAVQMQQLQAAMGGSQTQKTDNTTTILIVAVVAVVALFIFKSK